MRKYGKLLLVLGILAANPGWVSADGLLQGLRSSVPVSKSVQKQRNQQKAEEVGYALRSAKINGYDLQVEVRGDAVKLDGKVRDVTHRARAEQAVRRITGIKTVQNNLKFVPGGQVQQTSGQYVDSAVRPAYHMSGGGQSAIQQVHFQKPGKRRKTSTSSSTRQVVRQAPQARVQPPAAPPAMTYRVAENQAPPASMPMPSAPAIPAVTVELPAPPVVAVVSEPAPAPQKAARANQEIAQQIANNMAEVGLQGYDVEIRYDNGIATLGGEVASAGQRQAAAYAANNVPEVKEVRNQLAVQQSRPIAQTAFGNAAPQGQRVAPVSMSAPMPMMPAMAPGAMMGAPMNGGAPTPMGGAGSFSNPQLPDHAWPSYAPYPNSAAIQYPTEYSASAFPYIGPFYPYPQVPLGWRSSRLEWDDGHWHLNFEQKKDAWHWLFAPRNWSGK